MAKSTLNPVWKSEPDKHDYPAAASYLGLIADDAVVVDLVARLKKAPVSMHQAKDLLRAARLDLLPISDKHVAADLAKIVKGVKLSPVLLVRGGIEHGLPLTIADGYHRVCASYYTADDADIPARLVDLAVPPGSKPKK
ncbi:MAG: hypothetical protein ACO3J3_02910 [Candidatus Nanopelagicales bacterium]|jgi:hypothetical protein